VSVKDAVLAAAEARAVALGQHDSAALERLLHRDFGWTSHTGQTFDRQGYLSANVGSTNRWYGQQLDDLNISVVDNTAVLRCTVTDDVDTGTGRQQYRMRMTQTWVRVATDWLCLAGHAGPRM